VTTADRTHPQPDAVVDGIDVDALAAAVCACPGVAELSGGLLESAATYLPGRRVTGIVIRSSPSGVSEVAVHVVARYGPTMAEVATQVRTAAARFVPAGVVSVHVEDIALPEETAPTAVATPQRRELR